MTVSIHVIKENFVIGSAYGVFASDVVTPKTETNWTCQGGFLLLLGVL